MSGRSGAFGNERGMNSGMMARSGAGEAGMAGRSASNFHSAIADGQFHSFGGARGTAAGSALAGGRFAGNGFNHAGLVGGAGWRGGFGRGFGYGRGWGGYGWGGGWGWGGWGWGWGGWGLGWDWGWGWPYWGWDPYWNPYWGWSLYGY
jgi:hypothetical protein